MKRKSVLSVVVAAFMVVVLAGSAFAFAGGNVGFEGTASINAELNLEVVAMRETISPAWRDAEVVSIEWDNKGADIVIELDAPIGGNVTHSFDIVNTGTVPLAFNAPWPQNQSAPGWHVSRLVRRLGTAGPNLAGTIVLQPGEGITLEHRVLSQFAQLQGNYFDSTINLRVDFAYRWHQ